MSSSRTHPGRPAAHAFSAHEGTGRPPTPGLGHTLPEGGPFPRVGTMERTNGRKLLLGQFPPKPTEEVRGSGPNSLSVDPSAALLVMGMALHL